MSEGSDLLTITGITMLLGSALRLGLPIALAAVGEIICERAGILNLGLEGTMLIGALGSFLGTYYTGSPWVGVLSGVVAGTLLSVVMAFLSVTLKINQVIAGIAVGLLGAGLAAFLARVLFGVSLQPPQIKGMGSISVPLVSDIPILGKVLFEQQLLVYAALAIIVLAWYALFHMQAGVRVRACGDNPAAADALGVDVDRTRFLSVLVCGAMTGLGGAVLVVGNLHFFQEQVTAGRGWVALALVIFARWHPFWAVAGGLLFGLLNALQFQLQAADVTAVPFEFLAALPYVMTLAIMTISTARARRWAGPPALTQPFRREAH